MIAALLASGQDAVRAAALGVEIHARAGLFLAERWPDRGNGPREIADAVSLARAAMDIPRPGEEELRCAAYSLKG